MVSLLFFGSLQLFRVLLQHPQCLRDLASQQLGILQQIQDFHRFHLQQHPRDLRGQVGVLRHNGAEQPLPQGVLLLLDRHGSEHICGQLISGCGRCCRRSCSKRLSSWLLRGGGCLLLGFGCRRAWAVGRPLPLTWMLGHPLLMHAHPHGHAPLRHSAAPWRHMLLDHVLRVGTPAWSCTSHAPLRLGIIGERLHLPCHDAGLS
mmetsp:Transcript_74501/g.125551  ORF Transcript_74501/g.125551 Transcript_74501/m.125551 type:complete len:204 (-) Transcript_74501:1381-1992(-)